MNSVVPIRPKTCTGCGRGAELPIAAKTIAYNADSADLASWLDDMFLPPDVLERPLNVVVVRSGSQIILIDARHVIRCSPAYFDHR